MYKRVIKHISIFIAVSAVTSTLVILMNSMDNIVHILTFSSIFYLTNIMVKKEIIRNSISIIILLFIFINIIIIPYSFYLAWFQHLKSSIPQGRISLIFTILTVYLWIFFISTFVKTGRISDLCKLFTLLILISTLYINFIQLYIIFFSTFILLLIFNFITTKNYEKILPIIILVSLLSIISYKTTKQGDIKRSVIVENISYTVRKIIVNNFPSIDLLTTIPGMSDNFRNNNGKPPILTNNKLLKIKGNPGESYYLRMSVGYKNSEYELVDKKSIPINTTRKIKITVLSDFLPILPTTIDTVTSNIYDLQNGSDFTYKIDKPLSKNSEFYLIKDSNNTILETTSDYIYESNIDLEKLAITLRADSDETTARNIRKYLLNNFEYSLDTLSNENYISNFLFKTKKGFCVHFTRAFILLARLNGIKCREISGYYTQIPRRPENSYLEYGEAIITGKNSHLWAEIYINEEWKTFEVTPSYYQEINEVNQEIHIPNTSTNTEALRSEEKPRRLYLLLSIPLSLLFILFKLYKGYIISKLIRLSEKRKIPHPKNIGWYKWNELFFKNDEYIKIIIEMNYSYRDISKAEVKELNNIYKKLRKQL